MLKSQKEWTAPSAEHTAVPESESLYTQDSNLKDLGKDIEHAACMCIYIINESAYF